MSLFLILLGGELAVTARLRAQVAGARVIAADSGMRHAAALGVAPELWVGDFDSAGEREVADHAGVARHEFATEKDETDGALAVAEALRRGATRLVLAGAFGGPRPDHAFLHWTLAIRLAEGGTPTLLSSGHQEGTPLLPGDTALDYADGTLFSILGFEDLSGLSIRGAKWPLDRVAAPFGSSLTLSNVVQGPLRVSFGSGRALLLAHLAA